MPCPHFPIPQGTRDMRILRILALEPAHAYGIAQRLEKISRSVVQVSQGSLTPARRRQRAIEKDSCLRLSVAVNPIFEEANQ